MRRTRIAAAGVVAVSALALVSLSWCLSRKWVERKTLAILYDSRDAFAARVEELIHGVQWLQSALVFGELDSRSNATEVSTLEMSRMADKFHIDELNVVSRSGRVIASNCPQNIGYSFADSDETVEFLKLVNPSSLQWRVVQPFRMSVSDNLSYCTYHGESFDDYSGFLQLGYRMDRLMALLAFTNVRAFRLWKIGRHGHYEVMDADGDGAPDVQTGGDDCLYERGVIDFIEENGERATRLSFAFAGHIFAAVVPEREFGSQQKIAFYVFALTTTMLATLFSVVLLKLHRSASRVAALRREADERQAADLSVARKIQLSSLPKADTFAPGVLEFDIEAASKAAREVGGDFYDFFWAGDRVVAFVIADVSGKGVPAALFMHEAKHTFVESLRAEVSLAAAVAAMNERLCRHNEAEMFVTAFFGILDIVSGEVEYVNAGHNRPYVLSPGGAAVRLDDRGGRIIGMFDDAAYRSSRLTLSPGDRLVLFTDGITEAMNSQKRPYGESRLVSVLESSPERIVGAVREDVAGHVGDAEQSDDLTMLVVRWNGPANCTRRDFAVGSATPGEVVEFLHRSVGGLERRQLARLVNAADELVANVVSYSGAKTLSIEVAEIAGRCRLTLEDDGVEYNPLAHLDPDTHLALDERPLGGLGILMVKRLVSYIGWQRTGERNCTTLVQQNGARPV